MSNLILYFSRKGENYFGGQIKSITKGNTEVVAEAIQAAVGGDLFEIERAEPYAADYHECVSESRAELAADARPEVKALPDIAGYSTIYLGYPNWCGTIPMPVATVLEALNWNGKTIRPFCTNEGSGMGSSERDIFRLAKGATLGKGLPVNGSRAAESAAQIAAWAKA